MDFDSVYKLQEELQQHMVGRKACDDPKQFMEQVCLLSEEVGEVLQCDKRYRTVRDNQYNREQKLEEMADVFIVVLNLFMWSGFTKEEAEKSIVDRLQYNIDRIDKC